MLGLHDRPSARIPARLSVAALISSLILPSQILVGFSDKLRLFNILMNDLQLVADFAVKGCRCVSFARGGQYFAAVSGPHIFIFSTCAAEWPLTPS